MEEIYAILIIIVMFYISSRIFKYFIFPKLLEMDTKELEKNPKWIMGDVRSKYYGFQDIDIIVAETNLFSALPRFRVAKNDRFELLVPSDVSTKDVNEVLKLAMIGKINVKYGLMFTDKPLHWLCILCYMLDGGDIKEAATSWESDKTRQENS